MFTYLFIDIKYFESKVCIFVTLISILFDGRLGHTAKDGQC